MPKPFISIDDDAARKSAVFDADMLLWLEPSDWPLEGLLTRAGVHGLEDMLAGNPGATAARMRDTAKLHPGYLALLSRHLMAAASVGEATAIERLSVLGADLDAPDKRGWTPMDWAQALQQAEFCAELARCGAKPGSSLLHVAAKCGRSHWLLRLLDTEPADALDAQGRTPLHIAAIAGHSHAAEILASNGVGVNHQDEHGNTALHYAAGAGHSECVKVLLDEDFAAGVDLRNRLGAAPLHAALLNAHLPEVKALVAGGADLWARVGSEAPAHYRGLAPREMALRYLPAAADLFAEPFLPGNDAARLGPGAAAKEPVLAAVTPCAASPASRRQTPGPLTAFAVPRTA